MSPTGGLALLIVVAAVVSMIVLALIKGNSRRHYAPTDEKDLVRRVKLTLSPGKADELAKSLIDAVGVVRDKKKSNTPEKVTVYANDANGNGECLVEVYVKRV